MPKYQIETNQGTYEVEADREPTPDEVLAQIGSTQGSTEKTAVPQGPAMAVPSASALPGYVPEADNPFPVFSTERGGQVIKSAVKTLESLGARAGGPALGQSVGAMTGPVAPVAVPVLGALGGLGGEIYAQRQEGTFPRFGQMLAATATGAIPGASVAKAGTGEVLRQGAKYALVNAAATYAEKGIDEKRLPTLGEVALAEAGGFGGAGLSKFLDKGARAEATRIAAQQDAVRRETLKAGRSLGLVLPPSVPAPGPVNNALNSIAGKAAAAQEATLRNQPKINDAVRAEIGLPIDAPLSPIAINTQRVAPNMVYDKIAKTSGAAAGLLANFKQSMADANDLYATYRAAPIKDPATLASAKAAETQAEVFKQGLSKVVAPDLMAEFDAARVQLAKIGLAERALNVGDGNIDAKVLGEALDAGEKMTGNFRKIARFQNAFGRYVQEAAKTPPSGVDYLKAFTKIGAGGGIGYAAGGVPGAIAGAAAMTASEKAARELALSPFYQRAMANPFYGSTTEDFPAGIARLGTMAESRELPADDTPLTEDEMRRLEELRKKLKAK